MVFVSIKTFIAKIEKWVQPHLVRTLFAPNMYIISRTCMYPCSLPQSRVIPVDSRQAGTAGAEQTRARCVVTVGINGGFVFFVLKTVDVILVGKLVGAKTVETLVHIDM